MSASVMTQSPGEDLMAKSENLEFLALLLAFPAEGGAIRIRWSMPRPPDSAAPSTATASPTSETPAGAASPPPPPPPPPAAPSAAHDEETDVSGQTVLDEWEERISTPSEGEPSGSTSVPRTNGADAAEDSKRDRKRSRGASPEPDRGERERKLLGKLPPPRCP
ncbi:hypothetical protein BC834DRAFT_975082 [Gloeopeniophorella convolvens]|nr:hypothetical protein BC834DRAFT_975082 [Gloeopeniophorella convolvens]